MLSLLIKRLKGKTPRDVMRFMRRKVLAILTRSAIQKRVDDPRIEIVHVMFNDKFNKPYVDFLNRNFDTKKHLVLCLRVNDSVATPFPVGDNVVEIYDIRKIDLSAPHIKKIICHSLFDSMLVDKLHDEPDLLKKSCWIMWGGDLYDAPRDEKNDFVRKNFGQYYLGPDSGYAYEKYGITGIHAYAPYQYPLSREILDATKRCASLGIRIQINNSSSKFTLDALNILSRFKNENIQVTTILSYGDISVKDKIIKTGQLIFGDKFSFLDKMLSPSDYAQFICENDILVLNQDRQQGFGNTIASLYLGCKVFVRGDTSVPKWLEEFSVYVYDTNMMKNMEFSEFVRDDRREENMKASSVFFDELQVAEMWKAFF